MLPLGQSSLALSPIISATLVVPGAREWQTDELQLLANASVCTTLPSVHHHEMLLRVWAKDLLLHEPEECNSVLSKAEEAPLAIS